MRNFWSALGAISGVLAVTIAIYIFVSQRSDNRKELSVEVIARSALLNSDLVRPGKKIEVLVDGKPVPNYSLIQVRVSNSGGQSIRTEDFDVPLELQLQNVDSILSTDRVAWNPSDIPIKPEVISNKVTFTKGLMNSGDWLTVEIGFVPRPGSNPVKVSGRIAGIKSVDVIDRVSYPKQESKKTFLDYFIAGLSFTLSAICFLLARATIRKTSIIPHRGGVKTPSRETSR